MLLTIAWRRDLTCPEPQTRTHLVRPVIISVWLFSLTSFAEGCDGKIVHISDHGRGDTNGAPRDFAGRSTVIDGGGAIRSCRSPHGPRGTSTNAAARRCPSSIG